MLKRSPTGEPRPADIAKRAEETQMKRLTTEDLRDRLEAGPVALFDVRGDVEFERAHIPGAKTAPLGSLTFRVASVMNPDSFVAVYSSGVDGLATEAAQRLEDLRLRNIHVYEDGLEGWARAGNEVVESAHAKTHTRGEVLEVRPLVVDRENAYGGIFSRPPEDVEGAGG
jgi:rhodanese-related sulfurtransferase